MYVLYTIFLQYSKLEKKVTKKIIKKTKYIYNMCCIYLKQSYVSELTYIVLLTIVMWKGQL